MFCRISHIKQVRSQRQMRPVLLDNPEWQQANAFRLLNPFNEVSRREFFPLRGKFLRRCQPRSKHVTTDEPRQRSGDDSFPHSSKRAHSSSVKRFRHAQIAMVKSIEENSVSVAQPLYLPSTLRVFVLSASQRYFFAFLDCAGAAQYGKVFPATAFRHSRLQDSPHPFLAASTPDLANCIESVTNPSRLDITERWVRWLRNRN